MTPVITFQFGLVQLFNINVYLNVKSRMEKGFFKLPDCKFTGFWLSVAWFSENGSLKNKDKLAILKCAESSKFILKANQSVNVLCYTDQEINYKYVCALVEPTEGSCYVEM